MHLRYNPVYNVDFLLVANAAVQIVWRQKVRSKEVNTNIDINLPSGIYFIQVLNKGAVVGVEKFVKQ